MGELRQTLGDLERLLGEDSAGEQRPMPARAALADQARASVGTQGEPLGLTQPSTPSLSWQQPSARPEEDSPDLQLLTRFVAGALILGAEELVARARRWEQQGPSEGQLAPGGSPLGDATHLELARYWTLGAVAYGRRTGVSALRAALRGPEGVVPGLVSLTDRATSVFFLRPLRRPVTRAIRHAQDTARDWIVDGWREEQLSRWIAQKGVPEILDDVIQVISRNPELAELVRKQLSQQSASVASSVIDSGRKLSAIGDDVAESFARRLLRRGRRVESPRIEPKSELPPEMALRAPPGNDNGQAER